MGKNDFYSSSSLSSVYGTSQTEPNMRVEFERTMDGHYPEIAKSQPALLRKMRLDGNGQKTKCSCVDNFYSEPEKDRFCPICFGEGYLWDETALKIYRVLGNSDTDNALLNFAKEPGLINIPVVIFYVWYSTAITEADKIATLSLDTSGSAIVPNKRTGIYRIEKSWDYRSDNGKLEYFKLFTRQESVKWLNSPSYSEA